MQRFMLYAHRNTASDNRVRCERKVQEMEGSKNAGFLNLYFELGYGQNVPMPKRTQPKRTQFWSKRTHFFGQNVPSPPKRTQPFGQNVPNIFFPDIQYIFLLFLSKKSYLHIGLNVPNIYLIFKVNFWYIIL